MTPHPGALRGPYTPAVPTPPPSLPDALRRILGESFVVRVSHRGRRTGIPRVLETTYRWDGGTRVYLSGYPGRRDWVANMAANPDVTLHTVESHPHYDIPARARVLRASTRRRGGTERPRGMGGGHRRTEGGRDERMDHVLAFVERWAARGAGGPPLRLALRAIRLNRALRLPWWGPFYLVRRVLDAMPCVEIEMVGEPTVRPDPPPEPTGARRG